MVRGDAHLTNAKQPSPKSSRRLLAPAAKTTEDLINDLLLVTASSPDTLKETSLLQTTD